MEEHLKEKQTAYLDYLNKRIEITKIAIHDKDYSNYNEELKLLSQLDFLMAERYKVELALVT